MNRKNGKSSDKMHRQELITLSSPLSPVSEAYRNLRTNLGFAGMEHPFRSILVASANPQEGKSTVVSNLAVVMAQAGNKVILVDCDLRKPVQHKIFKLANRQGFTNCILQQLEVNNVAQKVIEDKLTVLTSGPIPPNPAEILNSSRTRAFWKSLLGKYDYVLIDAPPAITVTDAAVLSNQVDGVILVVNSGVTTIEAARLAKSQFNKANARILGVILNQVKTDNGYYYDYC